MRGLTITPCTMPPHLMIMKLCLWFTSLSEHLWNLFLQAVLKYCFRTWKHCIAVHTFHLLLDCTNHRKIASLKNSTEGADHSLRVFFRYIVERAQILRNFSSHFCNRRLQTSSALHSGLDLKAFFY